MFAAVVPPNAALAHLEAFLEPRRASAPFRWTAPDQVHATLAFYAEVADRRLDELVERLGRAAGRRTPVATAIAAGGAFPDPRRARVLWAGLDLDEGGRVDLDRLAAGCRAAASRAGVVVDGQRFRPHLTLARTGRPGDVGDWVRLLDAYTGPRWTADRVQLVASYLGQGPRGRPRYETVAELPIG